MCAGRGGGGLLPTRTKSTEALRYLGVVDLGDERERVLPGLPYVLDGQLDRRLDALADAAHQGRLVHGHEDHDGQVLPVPGEPAVVLSVLGAVVAHLGQRRVQQQSAEQQASRRDDHLPAAAVPPGWSHATVHGVTERETPPPPTSSSSSLLLVFGHRKIVPRPGCSDARSSGENLISQHGKRERRSSPAVGKLLV